jgi:hypothetical protein
VNRRLPLCGFIIIERVNRGHGWKGLSGAELMRTIGLVVGSTAFRWLCFAVMIWLALHGEARPAPRVPDLVIDNVPYVEIVDRWNYWFWVIAYGSMGISLLVVSPRVFCHFMITGGILSLIRGVCILFTGLGPLRGDDVNAVRLEEPGMLWTAFFELIDPTGVLVRRSAHLYLTKDLFFSGHTATLFLVTLYLWRWPRLRWTSMTLHFLVVATIFLGHIHYTIDVIGAWAITFSLFVLREGRPWKSPY